MKVIDFVSYLDGGSFIITTDKGIYWFNKKINDKNKNKLLFKEFSDSEYIVLNNTKEIIKEIIVALKDYIPKNKFYEPFLLNGMIESNILNYIYE